MTKSKRVEGGSKAAHDANSADSRWFDGESAGCSFKDARLARRFEALLSQLSGDPGGSIPMVCQDWANTKAAYRFLANARVNEADILTGHFQSRAGYIDLPMALECYW